MNRFRLATSATLVGVVLATGCASPCDGCRPGVFQRMSMFRGRRACCPCECCSSSAGGCGSCCGGGGPFVGGGAEWGDGPFLDGPGGSPLSAIPPAGAFPPSSALPPPGGVGAPAPFPPSLGAPLGTPSMPIDPGRLNPIPNGAQPFEAGPSSRIGRR